VFLPPLLQKVMTMMMNETQYGILQGNDYTTKHILNHNKTIVGRSEQECNIVISSQTISASHASIEFFPDNNSCVLADLASMNGTLVNQHRVIHGKSIPLKHGDAIRFGFDSITYQLELYEPYKQYNLNTGNSAGDSTEFFTVVQPVPQQPLLQKNSSSSSSKQKKKAQPPVSDKLAQKLSQSRNELSTLISSGREKQSHDSSTLTFPTADGKLTVSLPNEMEDDESNFQIHSTAPTSTLQEQNPETNQILNPELKLQNGGGKNRKLENQRYNQLNTSIDSSMMINNLENRVSALESSHNHNQLQTEKSIDVDNYQMSLLVDTVHSLATTILKEMGPTINKDLFSSTLNRPVSEMIPKLQESKQMLKTILQSIKSFKRDSTKKLSIEENQNNNVKIESDINLRCQGIERYANELQKQVNDLMFKLEQSEIELSHVKNNGDYLSEQDQQHYVISAMQDEIIMKSKEVSCNNSKFR
jgi:hypothetical protein